jgi:hypothetical protein
MIFGTRTSNAKQARIDRHSRLQIALKNAIASFCGAKELLMDAGGGENALLTLPITNASQSHRR